jgi:arylsulfatase A-like enzyme
MVDDISLSANVDVETLASDKPWLLARWRRSHSGLPAAEGFDDTRVLKAILREYYQSVENVNWNMGRLIDALERLELWDDTVVMFFSDHGELLGSHGTQGKQLPFAESVGIPLIVCGGALAAADGRGGRLVSNPVSIEDLHSTTLDLAGLPAPASKPGRSLMPLLEPSIVEGFDREAVFLEYVEEHRDSHKSIPPWRAVRTARYSYAITRDGPWLLFDLEDDPYELTNRVGDAEYAETRGNLHRRLVAHLRAIEDPFERMHAHE